MFAFKHPITFTRLLRQDYQHLTKTVGLPRIHALIALPKYNKSKY